MRRVLPINLRGRTQICKPPTTLARLSLNVWIVKMVWGKRAQNAARQLYKLRLPPQQQCLILWEWRVSRP